MEPPHARARALGEVLLCSGAPTQLVIGTLLHVAGVRAGSDAAGLSLTFVVAVSLLDTAALVGLMIVLTRTRGDRVSELWLGSRPVWSEAMRGVALIPAVLAVAIGVVAVLRVFVPALHNVATNPFETLARGGAFDAAVLGAVAVVAGGFREELQRAFLLDRFERHLGGTLCGVVVTSVGFGLGHALQGWDVAVATGTLGAFWAVLYVRRRSAVAPLVSHAGFNALEVLRVALWNM
jgi:membrane protease YdiL (CAAX protease family)